MAKSPWRSVFDFTRLLKTPVSKDAAFLRYSVVCTGHAYTKYQFLLNNTSMKTLFFWHGIISAFQESITPFFPSHTSIPSSWLQQEHSPAQPMHQGAQADRDSTASGSLCACICVWMCNFTKSSFQSKARIK